MQTQFSVEYGLMNDHQCTKDNYQHRAVFPKTLENLESKNGKFFEHVKLAKTKSHGISCTVIEFDQF